MYALPVSRLMTVVNSNALNIRAFSEQLPNTIETAKPMVYKSFRFNCVIAYRCLINVLNVSRPVRVDLKPITYYIPIYIYNMMFTRLIETYLHRLEKSEQKPRVTTESSSHIDGPIDNGFVSRRNS